MILAAIQHLAANGSIVWQVGATVVAIGLAGTVITVGVSAIKRFLD